MTAREDFIPSLSPWCIDHSVCVFIFISSSLWLPSLKLHFRFICFMCMSVLVVCLSVYQCESCAHGALKVLGPLELDLQIIVSHYVGARNQT